MTTTLMTSDGTITAYDGMRCVLDGRVQVFLRDRFWDVEDMVSGRVRIGSPDDWYGRITWAPHVWAAVHSLRFHRV